MFGITECWSQVKGLQFPGCHDPKYCRLVLHRSKLLMKPVSDNPSHSSAILVYLRHIPSQRSHSLRFISSSMYIFFVGLLFSSSMMISFVFFWFLIPRIGCIHSCASLFSHQSSFFSSSQEQRFLCSGHVFFLVVAVRLVDVSYQCFRIILLSFHCLFLLMFVALYIAHLFY